MLDAHPHLAAGPETNLFLPIHQRWAEDITGELHEARAAEMALLLDIPTREIRDAWRQSCCQVSWIDRLARAYTRSRGRRAWVEKTPRNVRNLDWILERFPRARFVHVIRDGRDVVCSLRTHPKYRWNPETQEREETGVVNEWRFCVSRWFNDTLFGLKAKLHPRTTEIRYEDLVTDPEPALRKLLLWLGIPWDPAVLDWHTTQPDSRHPAKDPQAVLANKPLTNAPVGRWRQDLTLEALGYFKPRVLDLLEDLGYTTDDSWMKEIQASADEEAAAAWSGRMQRMGNVTADDPLEDTEEDKTP
jgi:hypothetical protein